MRRIKISILLLIPIIIVFLCSCANEQNDFNEAKQKNSIESMQYFLKQWPNGQYKYQVEELLGDLELQNDLKQNNLQDWYSDYDKYINKFPNSKYVMNAKKRLAWLKTQKAVVVCEYPRVVEMRDGYHNLIGPVWMWDTVFKETGGKIGFKVADEQTKLIDIYGGTWSGSA